MKWLSPIITAYRRIEGSEAEATDARVKSPDEVGGWPFRFPLRPSQGVANVHTSSGSKGADVSVAASSAAATSTIVILGIGLWDVICIAQYTAALTDGTHAGVLIRDAATLAISFGDLLFLFTEAGNHSYTIRRRLFLTEPTAFRLDTPATGVGQTLRFGADLSFERVL